MTPCLPHKGVHPKTIESMLSELGVYLKPSTYSMDTKPLLKEACGKVFGSAAGLVDMIVEHTPSSRKATAKKVQQDYTGPQVGWRGRGGGGRMREETELHWTREKCWCKSDVI